MIVFRGVRVDNGEMVEGNYSGNDVGGHYIIDNIYMLYRGVSVEAEEVHPESLAIGDTNLTDKNGNVIFGSFEYEKGKMSRGGDVCEYHSCKKIRLSDMKAIPESSWERYHISFENGHFFKTMFQQENAFFGNLPYRQSVYNFPLSSSEIIGNAYANPELL